MKKLSKKEVFLLVILLFVVAGALYYYYYYTPMTEKIGGMQKQIKDKENQLNILQTQELAITKAKEEIAELERGLSGEIKDIPVGVDEPELLVFMSQAMADLADEPVIRFDPQCEPHAFYQVNHVIIGFTTNYEDLKTILMNFQNAPYRNSIKNLNLNFTPDPTANLGPDAVTGSDPVLDAMNDRQTEAPEVNARENNDRVLLVEMRVDFYSFPGEIEDKQYPFMVGPYSNPSPFTQIIPEETPEEE